MNRLSEAPGLNKSLNVNKVLTVFRPNLNRLKKRNVMSDIKYVNRIDQGLPEPRNVAPAEVSEPPKPLKVPNLYNQEDAPIISEQPVFDISTGEIVSREEWNTKYPDQAPGWVSGEVESLPEDNFGNTATDQSVASASGDFDPKAVLLKALMDKYGSSDLVQEFERFRTQVIMALKHLGLDTRKFFPER
jgi:hypothetical protein